MSNCYICYRVMALYVVLTFFFELCGDHRDLHVRTHSFPTRRSSDLDVRAVESGDHEEVRPELGRTPRILPRAHAFVDQLGPLERLHPDERRAERRRDRKSTRLNSSH